MALGMNINDKGKNIEETKGSTPKHTYNSLMNEKQNQKKLKLTSTKIDVDTLAKITFVQELLNVPKHEIALKDIMDEVFPKIIKKYGVSPQYAKIALKALKIRKR